MMQLILKILFFLVIVRYTNVGGKMIKTSEKENFNFKFKNKLANSESSSLSYYDEESDDSSADDVNSMNRIDLTELKHNKKYVQNNVIEPPVFLSSSSYSSLVSSLPPSPLSLLSQPLRQSSTQVDIRRHQKIGDDHHDNSNNINNHDNGSIRNNRSAVQVPLVLLSEKNKKVPPPMSIMTLKSDIYGPSSMEVSDTGVVINETVIGQLEHPKGYIVRKKRLASKNLCDGDCICKNENHFLAVECEFRQNREHILGPTKYIPKEATSLTIKLASNAQVRLDEGFFHHNNVNRIYIEADPASTRSQVELGPNVFLGNDGIFPEIEIVNCFTVVLRSRAFVGEFKLNISNCEKVIIFQEAFYNTTFKGHFENIADLRPQDKAFVKAQAHLIIISCTIDELLKLETSLKEIHFSKSTINRIVSGAFDVLGVDSITFDRCTIGEIKSGATTEKLYSKYLNISGCTINTIESKAIAGSGIVDVFIHNNKIERIQDNAIRLTSITAIITNNTIISAEENWFSIRDWSNVTVMHNKFGNFNRMNIEGTVNPVSCLFQQNQITIENKDCLNFTNLHCRIKEISFHKSCVCDRGAWLKNITGRSNHGLDDLRSELYCTVDETLKDCYNTTLLNVQKFERDICDYTKKKIDCIRGKDIKKINVDFIPPSDIVGRGLNPTMIYVIVGSSVLLILITIILCIVIRKIVKARMITIPLSEMSTANTIRMMKPSKSFSNDDRVIISQTLENMKTKYPPERYDQVYNNTKKLLQGNLTESEKVLTIGEIVKCLDECVNAGEDFVAFTDILYKNLAPKDNNQNDPVYEEPNLLNQGTHNMMITGGDYGQTNLDHIYAEPNSVQQPLLTNEYASPVDRNDQANLYTEPLPNPIDKSRQIISPYAIGTPSHDSATSDINAPPPPYYHQQQQQQQPSTSRNLPDILGATASSSSFKPSTSQQPFANNPQFHMTRSPNTHRKIPKYTIPSSKFKQGNSSGATASGSRDVPRPLAMQEDASSHSDHSGGSDITCKIDDIDYVDA